MAPQCAAALERAAVSAGRSATSDGKATAVAPDSTSCATRLSSLCLLREIRATMSSWAPKILAIERAQSGTSADDGDYGHWRLRAVA
jgi:hypothetical protein